jgi:peptidoglycan/xylan/chitin deacetylase (PgdA/CDA1 family)/SAM-dependent methyltransferase/GT2 family glycosyltransferase
MSALDQSSTNGSSGTDDRGEQAPRVTIVIPAYNRAGTIGETLDSVLAQTAADWETIVVDDGSADGTADAVMSYAQRDPRIRLHRQFNGGVSSARNAGIALARAPWLLFLDADDWLDRVAIDLLLGAVTGPAAETADADETPMVAIGRCVSVFPSGHRIVEAPPPAGDMFEAFANSCAHAIHTCLVPTLLVRRVGGFDETLVTAEDQDLWQRIARTRPRYVKVPQVVAYYRIRYQSASTAPLRLLVDSQRVIDRGHGPDPRLNGWAGQVHRGFHPERARTSYLYLAAYAAGLAVGHGQDPLDLLPAIRAVRADDLEVVGFANALIVATATGRAEPPERWTTFPEEAELGVRRFVTGIADKLRAPVLEAKIREAFDRQLAGYLPPAATGVRIGRSQFARVSFGEALAHVELEPGAERAVLELRDGRKALGVQTLAAADGVLPATVAADILTYDQAWQLLGRLLERTVYRTLDISAAEAGRVLVRRGGQELAELWDQDLENGSADAIHDAAGWTVFLQELWGLPDRAHDDFYRPRSTEPAADADAEVVVADGVVEVEVATPLPRVRSDTSEVTFDVSLAGVPLMALRIATVDGAVSPDRLRRAITLVGKAELSRVAVREAGLLGKWPEDQPLRARLAGAAARRAELRGGADQRSALLDEVVPPGRRAIVIGRRSSALFTGPASRAVTFPSSNQAEAVRLARAHGQMVVEHGSPELPSIGLYLPSLFDPEQSAIEVNPDAPDSGRRYEAMFAVTGDPHAAMSPYEVDKRAETLRLIKGRPATVLEIGCGSGFLTEQLARKAGKVIAIDVAPAALRWARQRCAALGNVEFRCLDIFAEPLPGPVDLILCSEVLYYAPDKETLIRVLWRIAEALNPGGALICTHANVIVDDRAAGGFDWGVPFGALGFERELRRHPRFRLARSVVSPYYRAQRYDVVRWRLRKLPKLPGPTTTRRDVPAPVPSVAREFVRPGGKTVERAQHTRSLPILIYHRIDRSSPSNMAHWNTTPEAFEQQLAWLVEHGYSPVSIAEWSVAAADHQVVGGRRVALTFDDGYQDFADNALPLLQKYWFTAELFVVTGHVGGVNDWEPPEFRRFPLMSWDTLRSLPESVVRIGAHTVTHPMLPRLDPAAAFDEMLRSRSTLEDELGRTVTGLAFPYGGTDEVLASLAQAAGFEHAYTSQGVHARPGGNLLQLPRVEVRGGTSLDEFARMVELLDT